MWKPGQLVTIDHKVYQVAKAHCNLGCSYCRYKYRASWLYPCAKCLPKIPLFCHLKPLKPKNHE